MTELIIISKETSDRNSFKDFRRERERKNLHIIIKVK